MVTESGETIFIEVNQTGQFLWKEEMDPELRMLDSFCRFLTNETKSRELLTFADYMESDNFKVVASMPDKLNSTPFATEA